MYYVVLQIVATLLGAAAAVPTFFTEPSSYIQTVYEFPNNSFIENLAVRSNGQILVTDLTSTELFLIDPNLPGHAVVVHNFTEAHALSGIAEYEPDVFAILAGDYFFGTTNFGQGTWTLWRVDLRGVDIRNAALMGRPKVSKIRQISQGQLLNGLSKLSDKDKRLIVGDTLAGVIYRVDTKTGDYEVVINSTYLSKLDTPHGVNGLHVFGNTLYFANSGQNTLVKVPINEDGTTAGQFTIIAKTIRPNDEYDDFTLDRDGNIFVATEGGNTILQVSADGKRQVIVAGGLNSTAVAEPTSAAFGRGLFDKNVLYVTTAGGSAIPVNGNIVIPGKLLAVKINSKGYI
ncbi:hypothetical protein AAE478_003204 [Parahypoxylon ruwenzoriense]